MAAREGWPIELHRQTGTGAAGAVENLADALGANAEAASDGAQRLALLAQLADQVVTLLTAFPPGGGVALVGAEAAGTLLGAVHDLEDVATAATDTAEAAGRRLVQPIERVPQPRLA